MRSARLPLAIVAAVLVAEVAAIALRPRDLGPEPVPVEARAYFSEDRLQTAERFRAGQRWIAIGAIGVELGVLALIVARPPRRLRDWHPGRPVLAGAAAGAAVSLALTTAGLPLGALARERAKDVGLVTQSWGGWAGDVVKSAGIGAVIAGAGGALLIFGIRRFGGRWWIPGAAVVIAFGAATTLLWPVVVDPLFNRFEPLPAGRERAAVLELADRAGVDVGEVYVMDASRRTTAANAYVAGLGQTKRVVLYDTLLEDFSFDELRLVVAHELSHVDNRDVPNGLVYLAIVAPFGLLAAARLTDRLGPEDHGPRTIPAAALALALLVPGNTGISNQLSRDVERRADVYAMELTGAPEASIRFQQRIAVQNVSDPDPPRAWQVAFGTHPTTLERIGLAEALVRRAGP